MLSLLSTVLLAGCPDAGAVLRVVEQLTDVKTSSWKLAFTRDAEATRLEASTGSDSLQRALPADASCAELESAAAVVLVSWLSSLRPVAQQPRVVIRPTATPAPTPPQAPRVDPAMRLGAGIGPSLWLGNTGMVWGGDAYFFFGPASLPLAAGLGLSAQGVRRAQLGDGAVVWSRLSLSAGAEVLLRDASPVVKVDGRVVSGAIRIAGSGVADARATVSWDLGTRLGMRFELAEFGRLRPFLALSGTAWLRQHLARFEGGATKFVLPWLEGQASLGIAWASERSHPVATLGNQP